ncbi:DUF3857 domain-containing protein [Flavobacterium succinicans]|uniref:DUF3857 domain-containing protein n=1 Tax=Flavobacterium succinicans TaxID=29536 RepID=A0A199XV38_9FLAO|nr:DUF3857 domain-containing protein [Flavobacterium succinicans]OAZ05287.1 hypothetical protein FLB_03180 [Flavobacterium succinicans]
MKFKFIVLFLMCFALNSLSAQEVKFPVTSIPDSLKTNANAVLRWSELSIDILSQREMVIKSKQVVTVLNEAGVSALDAYAHYDKSTSISSIQAIILDAAGNELKKFKRKDFKDHSAVDGGTLFSDNRVLYLDYTPISYPFTMIFECETETSTTAFIPQWFPITDYLLSVEKSVLNVTFPENLGFKKKESNFSNRNIQKTIDTATQLSYTASNLVAMKHEDFSPYFYDILPRVILGLESFHLEGVDGNAKTWEDFGKWYSSKILSGTIDLPSTTVAKIKEWVGTEQDPIKKARIVYDYVQQKVRYISVQVGIGGWKPMLASDVDRLGYGDCKALTNYTQALLKAVDVPSYYTILFGDRKRINIDADFVSMQGNHIILTIPVGNQYTWLECTSQTDPFGYQADFTDDRDVLMIKPEGGQIVHTKIYTANENSQLSKGSFTIAANGDFSGEIEMISQGTQYGDKEKVEHMLPDQKEKYYKEFWDEINNLKIEKITQENNKQEIRFTQNAKLSATKYGTFTADKMMVTVNAFNRFSGGVKRIRNRKTPFEIARGFYDEDEITIHLPSGFALEFIPPAFESKTKFGTYSISLVKKEAHTLIYKRVLLINTGKYSNKEYDEYRLFMDQVSQNDNTKIVLTKPL